MCSWCNQNSNNEENRVCGLEALPTLSQAEKSFLYLLITSPSRDVSIIVQKVQNEVSAEWKADLKHCTCTWGNIYTVIEPNSRLIKLSWIHFIGLDNQTQTNTQKKSLEIQIIWLGTIIATWLRKCPRFDWIWLKDKDIDRYRQKLSSFCIKVTIYIDIN